MNGCVGDAVLCCTLKAKLDLRSASAAAAVLACWLLLLVPGQVAEWVLTVGSAAAAAATVAGDCAGAAASKDAL
jgi:hypothetical protein